MPKQPHSFKDHTYLTVTVCNFCGDVMWGFINQGLQCSSCNFNCHHSCSKKVQHCHVNTPHLQGVEHNFVLASFSRPTFCNFCRGMLHGMRNQGLKCAVCKYTVHAEECNQKAPKNCRVCNVLAPPAQHVAPKFGHHWVEGNLAQAVTCVVCKKSCLALVLTNFRCIWCKQCVHSYCMSSFQKHCNFGEHASSVIPPYCVLKVDGASTQYELMVPHLPVKPVLVFVNPKSGGQQGNVLLRKLRYLLNPAVQVYSLIPGGPGAGLSLVKSFILNTGTAIQHCATPTLRQSLESTLSFFLPQAQNLTLNEATKGVDLRVVVCGGDGTAGWILQAMAEMELEIPVGIIPLGTGNDLARTLGWGPGYDGEDVSKLLLEMEHAHVRNLDRWRVGIAPVEAAPTVKIMTNYLSVGVDAKVALNFHLQREANPEQFKNRFVNKLWYTKFGAEAIFDGCDKLNNAVIVEIDGKKLELPDLECIIVVNLPSYAAGLDLWGGHGELPVGTSPQAINDTMLEVVGVEGSAHLGQIQTGLSHCLKLGQGRMVQITHNSETLPMQVDGEPWMQAPSIITISLRDQVPMLVRHH